MSPFGWKRKSRLSQVDKSSPSHLISSGTKSCRGRPVGIGLAPLHHGGSGFVVPPYRIRAEALE